MIGSVALWGVVTQPARIHHRWVYDGSGVLSRYYGGLNQLEGISRDMGVQLPGRKPLLAHVHGATDDELVRVACMYARERARSASYDSS